MEMEEWDEGDSYQQNSNAVEYNRNEHQYHQDDNQHNDYSNQLNNYSNDNRNDNYSHYNHGYVRRNNNNTYRRKNFGQQQYYDRSYKDRRGRDSNQRVYKQARPKYTQNNFNADTSYQSQHDNRQMTSNVEQSQPSRPSRPSRPFTSKNKFTGRNIEDDMHDINDKHYSYENDASHYNNKHSSYEVDESKSYIRHQHNLYQPNNNNYSQHKSFTTSKYNAHNLELENLGDRTKEMALQLMKGTYDCMICQSFIGKKARIWKCQHCFTMFHMTCVNKWAKAREQKDAENEQRPTKSNSAIDKLRCPACNYVETNFKFNQYKCFCDKVVFDHEYRSSYQYASSIPHSCGDICGKKRGLSCPHTCPAVCHPGPCQPCKLPSNRKSNCACGKLNYSLLCGQEETQSRLCGQICGKILSCGNHKCQLKCHDGDCVQCDIKIQQQCFCGKHKKLQPCGTGSKVLVPNILSESDSKNNEFVWKYSCNKICNKQLLCKNHKCSLKCHNGPCSDCPRQIQIPTRCACNKSTFADIQRKSCMNKLPVCKNKCGKKLGCGIHKCRQQCHDSPCNLCTHVIKKQCRCNGSVKKFKCHEYQKRLKSLQNTNLGQESWIRCGKKCKRFKSCGKHTCSEKCCPGRNTRQYFSGHQCRDICNKQLPCGKHKCGSYCHRGKCNPCGVTYRNGVSCACGAVFVSGPFQCGTKYIPTCKQSCNKLLTCGHYCIAKCHNGKCPPCIRICSKRCISHGLLVHNMPCHVDTRSCGNNCGKLLSCGTHVCSRTCHSGNCSNGKNNNGCGQICNRSLRCGHKCMYKCHNKCNRDLCKAQIEVKCRCGRRSLKQYCKGRTQYELKAVPCGQECKARKNRK